MHSTLDADWDPIWRCIWITCGRRQSAETSCWGLLDDIGGFVGNLWAITKLFVWSCDFKLSWSVFILYQLGKLSLFSISFGYDISELTYYLTIYLKEAFDTVCHEKLLKNLDEIGFRGVPHNLWKYYQSNRDQRVRIKDAVSKTSTLKYEVPKGLS